MYNLWCCHSERDILETVSQWKVMKQKFSECRIAACYGSHIGLSGLVLFVDANNLTMFILTWYVKFL